MRTGSATQWGGGRRRSLVLIVVMVVMLGAVLGMQSETHAQMLAFVPDPVTTPEFVGYAEMLGLSDAQRLAALDVHDAYRRDFRALEDGKVKAFIRDLTGLARVFTREGFRIPERSEFENLIEQFDAIVDEAKSIERDLIDRLTPILTEDQLTRLPSVRIEREMDVYSHLMDAPGELNPAAPIVLSAMVRELPRSDEEIQQTEEALRQYERNAVRRMRKLYGLLEEAAELALDTLDRTGVREMSMMELMQLGEDEEFEADMRVTFDEGSKPLQAELFAASQENLRLLQRLTPLLAPDNIAALRDRYYRRAYGRVYRQPSPWRLAYVRAVDLDSLDTEQRDLVGVQRDQFVRQEDLLIDRIVHRVEAWREYRTIEQMEDEEDIEQRIATYREDRETLGGAALAALQAILTPAQYASIEPGGGEDDANAAMQLGMGGGGGGGEVEVVVSNEGSDVHFRFNMPGMPRAVSAARRDQLARLAGLDEGQQAILGSLHGDYLADYAAAIEIMTQEDESAEEADDAAQEETREKEGERRVTRQAKLAALDDGLFESMTLVLKGDVASTAVAIGRGLRVRERATSAAEAMTFVFGREESYVDFVSVVLAMEQSVGIVASTKSLLEAYGATVGPLVEERLAAVRDAQRQSRNASKLGDRGPAGTRMAKKFEEKAAASRGKVTTLDGRIRDRNREIVDQVQSAVGEELGWTLQVAYQREAYPEVYEDELGVDDALAAVRALDDLTTRQNGEVVSIVADYRSAFSRLSERMVQLRRQRDFDFNAMSMPSQEVIEGEIELERLRFDRREAGSRAILRLRLVLDDAQIARSGVPELTMRSRRAFE